MVVSTKFNLEVVIIVGTFNRFEICKDSLESLIGAVGNLQCRVIVCSSSEFNQAELEYFTRLEMVDFLWAPGDVNMATARNLAVRYAQDKYTFDWVLFLEDDLIYDSSWLGTLVTRANELDGKVGPHGLVYKGFTASPGGIRDDEFCIFDDGNDCFSMLFGARADQRLFKASFYFSIVKEWDSDLLGISSAQTGKQCNRMTLRGFCFASIGHRQLCTFHPDDESTWVGQRDIGPAAFDKRMAGYKSIFLRAAQLTSTSATDLKQMETVPLIPPLRAVPMTATPYGKRARLIAFIRRIFGR